MSPIPQGYRPLKSGDRWRYCVASTGFRPTAIHQFYKPGLLALSVEPVRNPPTLSYDSLAREFNSTNPRKLGNIHEILVPDQYQHYIPRLVLRRFMISRTFKRYYTKSREKSQRPEELISCYNPSTGEITQRSVNKTYGVRNLYQDIKNPENPNEIELKLGNLEAEAGKVISKLLKEVKDKELSAKDASGAFSFNMTRKQHNNIRKFMHIMHYRKPSFSNTYWKEDDPDNAHVRPWISKYCERKDLNPDPVAMWLDVLRYYLDTPHPEIIEHGRKAKREDSRRRYEFPHTIYAEIDPNLENWQAVGYSDEADGFFLAIWEAAPGEEFILSANSFGIFEGSESPFGPIHRFYVISPRIALVLCSVGLGFNGVDPHLREHCRQSALCDATHKPPKVTDVEDPPEFKDIRERREYEAQENRRVNDLMEFEISTLSVEHTHMINAIILGNVNDRGLITFRSEKAMLQTLDSFGENPNFNNHGEYAPLVRGLLKNAGGLTPFGTLRFDSDEEFRSKFEKLHLMGQGNSEKHNSPEIRSLRTRFLKEWIRRENGTNPSTSVECINMAMSLGHLPPSSSLSSRTFSTQSTSSSPETGEGHRSLESTNDLEVINEYKYRFDSFIFIGLLIIIETYRILWGLG